MAKAYIGTSGWQYKGWRGVFYPQNVPQKDWLRYYSKHFDTVAEGHAAPNAETLKQLVSSS